MTKTLFIQSLVAGILAAIAANIYNQIYFFATEIDYSNIVNVGSMVSFNLLVSFVAGLVYWGLSLISKTKGPIIFNFVYSIGSFACVIIPIAKTLPLSTPYPEMFPGLTVPMVFFPVIAWMTIDPLFKKDS
ncbi:MAG: hypothetical protein QM734_06110 [Cyclobacteriaceae bacterium]